MAENTKQDEALMSIVLEQIKNNSVYIVTNRTLESFLTLLYGKVENIHVGISPRNNLYYISGKELNWQIYFCDTLTANKLQTDLMYIIEPCAEDNRASEIKYLQEKKYKMVVINKEPEIKGSSVIKEDNGASNLDEFNAAVAYKYATRYNNIFEEVINDIKLACDDHQLFILVSKNMIDKHVSKKLLSLGFKIKDISQQQLKISWDLGE